MDHATLPHAQTTISRGTQWQTWMSSVFTRRHDFVDIDCTLLYTDQQLPVVSTYVHGEAQTSLVRFVVHMFYKQIRNKSTTNQTSGVWALVYGVTSVYRRRCEIRGPPYIGLIVERSKARSTSRGTIFQSTELCVQKWVTSLMWILPYPFGGCHPYAPLQCLLRSTCVPNFEFPIFTRYGNTKSNAKCIKYEKSHMNKLAIGKRLSRTLKVITIR